MQAIDVARHRVVHPLVAEPQVELCQVFRQNRTVLIRVTLKRMQDPSVFRIRPAS